MHNFPAIESTLLQQPPDGLGGVVKEMQGNLVAIPVLLKQFPVQAAKVGDAHEQNAAVFQYSFHL